MTRLRLTSLLALFTFWLGACASPAVSPTPAPTRSAEPQTLRLATTTSTDDSGLLDAILPDFETKYNARVDVIAVGTGQALELGASGDVDVVLVHARAREDEFVANGDGVNRLEVMYNDFVVVGPEEDPAGVQGLETAKDAFAKIAGAAVPFASRGDDSGTYSKETSLWKAAALTPDPASGWYFSLGQGMGETLIFANEKPAYTLADRGTWLAQQTNLPNLALMVGGDSIAANKDKSLYNPYGVIPVNPEKHAGVSFDLATRFVEWITSMEIQKRIGEFGADTFGQPLFYPNSEAWKAAQE